MEKIAFSREELICNDKVVRYTFLVYVVFLIVQDLPLQLMFGTIARSPYIFLSPLVLALITLLSSKIYFFKATRYYLIYYLYSLLITLALVTYYVGFQNFAFVYGE